MTVRNGSADWHGDVRSGSGTITVGDGVFRGPYSYDSRFGEQQGTNPEQLIAAAQAGCFTMALASKLATEGHPPDLLRTNATVHLRMHDGSISLARLEIETEGSVKGIDEQQFSVRRRREGDSARLPAPCPVFPRSCSKRSSRDEGSRSVTHARRLKRVASAVGEGSIAVSFIHKVLQRS